MNFILDLASEIALSHKLMYPSLGADRFHRSETLQEMMLVWVALVHPGGGFEHEDRDLDLGSVQQGTSAESRTTWWCAHKNLHC